MPYSNLRESYSSTVQVIRLGGGKGPGRVYGGAQYNWVNSTDIIDPYWGVPGQMKCRIDVLFIQPGIPAPMPAETASPTPRTGTVFYDIPADPKFVRAGDHLEVVAGAYIGSTFEIKAIPQEAQDFFGPTHMEARFVEIAIELDEYPGVEPGSITR